MNVKAEAFAGIKDSFKEALDRIEVHDHLCLIYETRAEQFGAITHFIRTGLERGDKCIYIADDNTAADVFDAMRTAGIDVDSATGSGALAVITKKEAYLKEGYFDPDLMIRFWKESLELAKGQGYKALRVTGETAWMLGAGIGIDRVMEYESKLNCYFPEMDILAVCQYNRSLFTPEFIRDVIHTHPLVIYGETVCRNMYYVPPGDFLGPQKASREVERLLKNIQERELADQQVSRLNEALARKVEELEKKNHELGIMLKGFVNRELRIGELKERIRQLENKLKSGNAA
jgi:polyhydroxyalkanoate synthesis regulator phasin